MAFRVSPLRRLGDSTSFGANVLSNYVGRFWEALMGIAFVPLYIRFLGTESYGIIGLVAVIQSFMLILDFGMTPTLTRESARYEAGEHGILHLKDLIRSIEVIVLAVGLAIVAIVASFAPLIAAQWVKAEQLSPATISLALSLGGALIAGRFFESIFRGALYGLQRQALCNALAAFFATARALGSLAAITIFEGGLEGFFAWQIAISIASAAAMRMAVHFVLPRAERHGRFSREALASVGGFAGGMVLISLLSLAATQVDKVVLSRILSLDEFGLYIFAVNIAAVLGLVSAPLMTAIYPRIVAAASAGDEAGLITLFHRWARIVCVITAPIAAMLVWYATDIVFVWSGDPDLARGVGPIMAIVAVGAFVHSLCVVPYQVQLGYGWTSLAIWSNALALCVSLAAVVTLVPRFGVLAAAWSWVAVASVYFLTMALAMFRRYLTGERSRFLLRDVLVPAAAAFSVPPLFLPLVHLSDHRIIQFTILAASGALTLLATIGIVLAFDPAERNRLVVQLRSLVQRQT